MTASKNLRSGVQLTAFQANSSANQWNGVQLPQQFIETRNGWGWVAFSRLPLGQAIYLSIRPNPPLFPPALRAENIAGA